MARGEKDHGTNWLTQHHAPAILRLLGLTTFRGCRPAHARITLPQSIPDGLLEVDLLRGKKSLLMLVEWETYVSQDTETQVCKDMDLAEMAFGVLPDTVVIILSSRGKPQTSQRTQTSQLGWSERGHRWRVVELASISDGELLALNEAALIPLLPLTRSEEKPTTLLQQCKERIEQLARPQEQATLLTLTAIFATLRYARAEQWLSLLGGKAVLSQSPLYQQWMTEKECETRQEDIIRFLKARFKAVPEAVAAEIRTVTDLEQLDHGIEAAALCSSLKDFRKRLSKG